jgi:hypothetical protein
MVAKSIREAKSTVRGFPPGSTDTGLEPDCGVNVRPVIVTLKEMTPHWGASPPKTASVPGVVTMCTPPLPGPPHPICIRMPMTATDAIARIYFFIEAYLPPRGPAEAPGSRTAVLLQVITPPMLLNNGRGFQGESYVALQA